ncbi:unnamed protein product [Trifolium pratense]|uniref:Uncharacterized protein n=1 Tax=Trifolium pratense TaxID=57577 RepID=A0ACB0K9Y8_TRIPR|nr:unnamed protein product [Trifolium pratense]
MAIISLCFLAQTYQHASTVIQSLVEEDINVKFLVQLDKLIRLLETPVFAYLRLQVIYSGSHTAEDGDVAVDSGNSHNGINFVARLNQFQQMQQQHREHFRAQAQTRKNSTSVAKEEEVQRQEEETKRPHLNELNAPRSFKRAS